MSPSDGIFSELSSTSAAGFIPFESNDTPLLKRRGGKLD